MQYQSILIQRRSCKRQPNTASLSPSHSAKLVAILFPLSMQLQSFQLQPGGSEACDGATVELNCNGSFAWGSLSCSLWLDTTHQHKHLISCVCCCFLGSCFRFHRILFFFLLFQAVIKQSNGQFRLQIAWSSTSLSTWVIECNSPRKSNGHRFPPFFLNLLATVAIVMKITLIKADFACL